MSTLRNRRGRNPHSNKDTNVRQNPELKNTKKRELSKSTTCLNNSTIVAAEKGMMKSTSCSALNMPLPSEPSKSKGGNKLCSTTIYDDDFQMSIMLKENNCYASTNPNVSVAAMADKFNKGVTEDKDKRAIAQTEKEDHLYEQM